MSGSGFRLQSIGKAYGETIALRDFDLSAEPGEIVAITGPSGAGKTTVCRIVSGVEAATSGSVFIGGREVTGTPAHKRGVSHMFESYALYPHLTVTENISFPLRAPHRRRQFDRRLIESKVRELLELTRIDQLGDRLPGEMSGGQKQRVALCRALVQEAAVYVLDEPISHLDAKLRNELRGAIRRRQGTKDVPTVWTSPDAMEALSIGDHVAVLIDGTVRQYGAPEEIYQRPATTEVARLGRLQGDGGSVFFEREGLRLALPEALSARLEAGRHVDGIVLGVRPNGLDIRADAETAGTVSMRVYAWEPFGKYSIVTAQVGSELVRIKTARSETFDIDQTIAVSIEPSAMVAFSQASGEVL
jgi:ABC-type sugar transport system ATPase subunit